MKFFSNLDNLTEPKIIRVVNPSIRNENKNKLIISLPGELTCRFPALMTCKVQRPSAFSPQKWTLRKGQSSKLELRTSRGRSKSSVEVVPIGEVRRSLRFPRGKNLRETCKRQKFLSFSLLSFDTSVLADYLYLLSLKPVM